MPSHASFIAIVVTKDNFSSLTQGIAKYQTEKNEFKIVHWKYFYPYDRPYTEFSVGDIVMFTDKLIVENLEQYITVSSACVIASSNPKQVTDIDFMPTNVSLVQNTQESSFSSSSNNRSVIDLIANDINFAATTLRTSKRPRGMTSKSSKQGTNLLPIINEPVIPIPTPTTINIGFETIKNKK
ncbi:1624_t:CDS:2, partial [Gigaspora margarita]